MVSPKIDAARALSEAPCGASRDRKQLHPQAAIIATDCSFDYEVGVSFCVHVRLSPGPLIPRSSPAILSTLKQSRRTISRNTH